MAVTATRLGSAPITVDWSNLTKVAASGNASEEAWRRLTQRFNSGEVGFYDSPMDETLSQAKESQALAEQILAQKRFKDVLFLGIGGSSLGPISLLQALQERCITGLRFHFMENPDPFDWLGTLQQLQPETTLVCVVTKSGTTFETLAQFLLALEWLGKQRAKTHVVALTDPAKGDLKAYATREGIPTLAIAPSIGGRFSVFSPVGLFPAALSGLSITNFLNGARQMRDYMEKTAPEKNAVFILGQELLRQSSKRPIHVCMPYSTRLRSVASWFVQLWAESLGKDGKGFTPVAAVGATDQHSILQLLRDGPDDKITFFITVEKAHDPVRIPSLPFGSAANQLPAFKLLQGHTLEDLLRVEYRATSRVLSNQGRPNFTLQLESLDERSLGAMYFLFSILTAFTGSLLEVNPFDQPGVEEGKVYIRESLQQAASQARSTQEEDENSPVNRLRRDRD